MCRLQKRFRLSTLFRGTCQDTPINARSLTELFRLGTRVVTGPGEGCSQNKIALVRFAAFSLGAIARRVTNGPVERCGSRVRLKDSLAKECGERREAPGTVRCGSRARLKGIGNEGRLVAKLCGDRVVRVCGERVVRVCVV